MYVHTYVSTWQLKAAINKTPKSRLYIYKYKYTYIHMHILYAKHWWILALRLLTNYCSGVCAYKLQHNGELRQTAANSKQSTTKIKWNGLEVTAAGSTHFWLVLVLGLGTALARTMMTSKQRRFGARHSRQNLCNWIANIKYVYM